MMTASSPPLPPPAISTSIVSVLSPLRASRLLFRSPPPPQLAAAASLHSVGRGCRSWPGLRRQVAAGPSPPSSEPPPPSPHGWQERLSRLQDRVRIFFAVFFWMSLFFWGSAWDGSNNSGGKKRQRRKKSK